MAASATASLLPIVEAVDNFQPHSLANQYVPFYLSSLDNSPSGVIGQIAPEVLKAILALPSTFEAFSLTLAQSTSTVTGVYFHPSLDTPEARSKALTEVCLYWRESGMFAESIGGKQWRNELYTVYTHPFKNVGVNGDIAFSLERSACELFGLVTYGVHMTMYTPDYKIWVPRRSKTKQTWPGFLDNSVAGGIPYGMTPFESMIKECEEEASLSEEVSRKSLRVVGVTSYFYRNTKGNLQPEVEYVYDMLCPSGDDPAYVPKPLDGEVESFELMDWEAVVEKMRAGEFKRNSALVLLDFLIRHGKVTPENEPNYIEIMTRMHGRFGFEG
ncbi:hypothetical protein BDV93DRAFT_520039 [Ceratobasidium sp. AG-I]|nr:hypothetical protein BDV93DRAFT_520039 [Ceratobasidium sp. AG-I]